MISASLACIAYALAFSGIGLWMSTRYPNFDASYRGNPDTRTSYIYMLICLAIGYIIGGMPFAIYINSGSYWLGLFGILLGVIYSAIVFTIGFTQASRKFSQIEV